jgi:hypothetical protein
LTALTTEIDGLADELVQLGAIKEKMKINNFIDQPGEAIEEVNDAQLLQHCIELYADRGELEHGVDEELEQPEVVSTLEAIEALNKLRLYEEAREQPQPANQLALRRLERSLISQQRLERASYTKQTTLHDFFGTVLRPKTPQNSVG